MSFILGSSRSRHCGLPALVMLLSAGPAAAQAVQDGRTLYQAAFFVPFAPANALQVVERTPGFRLEDVDKDIRGFGQAAGNIVINGQRPSAKSDTLATLLSRIPAGRVVRVEVGSGDLFGAEFSGRPQVLNLVLTDSGGLAGNIEAKVRRDFAGALKPEGQVSALLKRGTSTFNAALAVSNEQTTEEGSDTVFALPGRTVQEFRKKRNYVADPYATLSASWSDDSGANRTAHLNAQLLVGRFALTQTNRVTPADGLARDDRLTQRYETQSWELGGDITRPFAGGGLKLIGLLTRRRRDNRDVSRIGVDLPVETAFAQSLEDRRDESLLRLVWTRPDLGGWNLESGGEAVLNRLQSDVVLVEREGAVETPIDLPIGNAVVKELRGELFANAGRQLTPKLRLGLGLTGEASRLTVSGDATARRTLAFLKPKASLDARAGRWKLQGSVQRSVAQLQFEDFISVAELTNDRVNGGNADLQPQRAWEFLLTAERPILGDGVVRLELGYNLVSKVQDRVPTPEGFDAPGNLGAGTERIARINLDAPLKRLGIKGGRFTSRLSVVDTSVQDPYTLRDRRFSGNTLWILDTIFRQDLGAFAWGVSGFWNSGSTFYRCNEEDRNFRRTGYITAFAEARPDSRTTITLAVDNLTGIQAYRERIFFEPDRTSATPVRLERRERNQHIIPSLSVKRTFG